MEKELYWSLKLTLGVLGVIALFNNVPHLLNAIQLLVPLYKQTDKTPEFKLLLLCISIWVNCVVINTIVNLVFKLHSLLEDKLIKKCEVKPNSSHD